MSLTADDVLHTLNLLLKPEGIVLDPKKLHYQIVGDLFEEHDAGDEFVGQVLRQYQIKPQGWLEVDTIQELIDFIVQEKNTTHT
ncbi:hypothetical protein BegalDRAFT_3040 [Beggiatoa alba B18LD]|uniref:Acyl carrier protein n=1 Tax=Beggiatoa alba B18LD TaxID=395493 RepID=I3CJS3_9GAMM|nr:hypothetical protein [Beggiatoa alba]EIJ43866.1 hypothetical protein BegalDRAFT_3040 [Beggiatoa alba B18LD]